MGQFLPLLNVVLPQLRAPETHVTRNLDSKSRQEHFFALFSRLFHYLAKQIKPVVLVDDLHWFDRASFELLLYILADDLECIWIMTAQSRRGVETDTGGRLSSDATTGDGITDFSSLSPSAIFVKLAPFSLQDSPPQLRKKKK